MRSELMTVEEFSKQLKNNLQGRLAVMWARLSIWNRFSIRCLKGCHSIRSITEKGFQVRQSEDKDEKERRIASVRFVLPCPNFGAGQMLSCLCRRTGRCRPSNLII